MRITGRPTGRPIATRPPLALLCLLTLIAVVATACGSGTGAASASATASEAPGSSDGTHEMSPGPTDASMAPTGEASGGASASETEGSAALDSDPLHAIRLVDVATGEQFTIGQLAAEKPVLLETMAIWCTNCRAQMHNVVAAHNEADFHSISLDVDPGEQPDDLAAYAEQEGFDWAFAMADANLIAQLRDRFGTAVAVPPGMPKILFGTDGSVELVGLGEQWTAQQIADAVAAAG